MTDLLPGGLKWVLGGMVAVAIIQEIRIRKLEEKMQFVGDSVVTLLEESYQAEIDEEFDEILEANGLDDDII